LAVPENLVKIGPEVISPHTFGNLKKFPFSSQILRTRKNEEFSVQREIRDGKNKGVRAKKERNKETNKQSQRMTECV
jgi:hypothetical protein